jgi:hypothetical protein
VWKLQEKLRYADEAAAEYQNCKASLETDIFGKQQTINDLREKLKEATACSQSAEADLIAYKSRAGNVGIFDLSHRSCNTVPVYS